MDREIALKLREKFAPDLVGKLPRVTCPKCANPKKFGRCDEHEKSKCPICKAYVSERHIHIDYVGHADATARLLDTDPDWNWEPKHRDIDPSALAAAVASGNPEVVRMVLENAPPKYDLDSDGDPVGLWINLTVCGTTRPGYGSVPSGQNDAVKVLIGDAIRNAAMRFGVALDLWAKGDRADPAQENATASGGQAVRNGKASRPAGDAWENAQPAPPRRNGQQNGGGRVSRPSQERQRTPLPPGGSPDRPVDEEAQTIADEAAEARTLPALKDSHTKAHGKGKLQSLIKNRTSGQTGPLGVFLEWRRKQLADEAKALSELRRAAQMPDEDLDTYLKSSLGFGLEDATAAQMREAAKALTETARAS